MLGAVTRKRLICYILNGVCEVKHLCPVCGYYMEDTPSDYNICPSCGTEFGLHDVNSSIGDLRAMWLRNGAHWWSPVDPVPSGWDPYAQVKRVMLNNASYTTIVHVRWTGLPALGANSTASAWEPTKRMRHADGFVGSVPSANGTISAANG